MKLAKFDKAVSDKLKIAFHIDDVSGSTAESINAVLSDLLADERATAISIQGKGYANRYRVPMTEDDALIIQINPNSGNKTDWGMTWEYTPSHLLKAGRKGLKELATEILGTDSQALLSRACIYEHHIAIDFPIDIADIAIESRDKSACGAWGKTIGSNTRLQTLYFGSASSDHHQIAYDKRAEILYALTQKPETKLKHLADRTAELGPRLRVEDRQRLSRCPVPLHRLRDLREPFSGFHIYSYDLAASRLKSTQEQLVLALAKTVGLQAALKHLSKSERETARRALAKCQVEWWEPSTYSQAITSVLQATKLFPLAAFELAGPHQRPAEYRYVERQAGEAARGTKRARAFSGLDVSGDDDDEDKYGYNTDGDDE